MKMLIAVYFQKLRELFFLSSFVLPQFNRCSYRSSVRTFTGAEYKAVEIKMPILGQMYSNTILFQCVIFKFENQLMSICNINSYSS